ncbi:MAG: hypothetical protein ACERKN_17420 [Velocimicrobium sp.]
MNSERLKECTLLTEDILRNIELSEIALSKVILKGLRLCRLLGDLDGVLLFSFEASGYPENDDGKMTNAAWRISKIAGRRYYKSEENESGEVKKKEYAYLILVNQLENHIETGKLRIQAAQDPTAYSGEITPLAISYTKNGKERQVIANDISQQTKWIGKISGSLYNYVLDIYSKLRYGNIMEDIFTECRLEVNSKLIELCPEAIKKFNSVYDNIDSRNSEDWANAIHSCRRILNDFADSIYPPSEVPIMLEGGKTIKVGKDQYINRMIQYISNKSKSNTYASIVGSDLKSIGERIDAVNNAVCKGTHSNLTKNEASRYLIHTYLLISDILNLG